MFNTPLGKKLFENMLNLSQHVMTGKAAMYTDVVKMINDFIKRNDGATYFTKKMSYDDLEKIILYIHDNTDYRMDIKLSGQSLEKMHIIEIFNEYDIKFEEFHIKELKNINMNDRKSQFALWNDILYSKLTIVINTGIKENTILNMDVILKP